MNEKTLLKLEIKNLGLSKFWHSVYDDLPYRDILYDFVRRVDKLKTLPPTELTADEQKLINFVNQWS